MAAIIVPLLVGSHAALAAASDWADSEGGRVRLIAMPAAPDGSIRAALEIDLKPGWKTYWREPGETGIPPQIDFSGSINLAEAALLFPPPEAVDDGYSVWAGYTAPLALPLTLRQIEAGRPTRLKASVFLGICETICIPFQASFDLAVPMSAPAKPAEAERIAAAFSRLPETAGRDFAPLTAQLASSEDSIAVTIRLPPFRPGNTAPALFAAGPAGSTLGAGRLQSIDGDTARFAVPVLRQGPGVRLRGSALTVVVRAGPRSMEATVPVR